MSEHNFYDILFSIEGYDNLTSSGLLKLNKNNSGYGDEDEEIENIKYKAITLYSLYDIIKNKTADKILEEKLVLYGSNVRNEVLNFCILLKQFDNKPITLLVDIINSLYYNKLLDFPAF